MAPTAKMPRPLSPELMHVALPDGATITFRRKSYAGPTVLTLPKADAERLLKDKAVLPYTK